MGTVRIDGVDNSIRPAAVVRPLTDALGTSALTLNDYELEPDDSFAFA